MKKAIVFAMLLVISAASFSQRIKSTPPLTKQDYLQKSKNQKTAAWILLGGGIAMFAIAAPGNVSFGTLGALVVVGSAAIIGSIPLFLAAHRNKKKSMTLSFKNEMAPQVQKSSFVYRSVPSLTLKIGL